ncbi:MAG TPA: methyltransferase domain-containing protein [Polyangiaceae bacterium]
MSDGGAGYIFEATANSSELERLQALEAIFDPATRELLASALELGGRRVLEVGAGAGSIARWLGEQVGAAGQVVALDTNVRFLSELSGVEVIEGSVTAVELPPFDLVHARYVAVHNADPGAFLEALVRLVAPGGLLVLEEPDFRWSRALAGPTYLRESFDRVHRAVVEMFTRRGMDPGIGSGLGSALGPSLELQTLQLSPHVERGGSALSQMMWLSTRALAEKYTETGCADESDIAHYEAFSHSPECWGLYYATGSLVGRRRAS